MFHKQVLQPQVVLVLLRLVKVLVLMLDVTGLEATGGVTEPTIIGDAPNVAVTGVAATGTVGTITAINITSCSCVRIR